VKDFLFPAEDEIEVLIVDDHEGIREYLRQIFSSLKITSYEATNGIEGLYIAIEKVPDIIISDLIMPEMDGLEMIKKLKQNEVTNHIPVIMLTAKSALESRLEGLKAQADVYLVKPFVVKELLTHIQNFLSLRKKIKETISSSAYSQIEVNNNLLEFKDAFIQKIIKIVVDQLDNQSLSIEDISQLVHLSRTQVHRKVKTLTGHSTSVFVRNIRLEKAYLLLKNRKGNVSEIAFQTGFNSASYFSTCFSEYFGYPPTSL
jgi:YesN/AraC family two-component response regulator